METQTNNPQQPNLFNQARIYDKKRLVDRFGEVDDADFDKIKTGFRNL